MLSGLGQGLGLGFDAIGTGTAQAGNLFGQGNQLQLQQVLGSLGLIPGFQAGSLAQLGAVNQLGLQQYGLDQAAIDALAENYYFNQNSPFNLLSQFQQYISGPYGSTVGPAPYFPNYQLPIGTPGGGSGYQPPPGYFPPNIAGGQPTGGGGGGGRQGPVRQQLKAQAPTGGFTPQTGGGFQVQPYSPFNFGGGPQYAPINVPQGTPNLPQTGGGFQVPQTNPGVSRGTQQLDGGGFVPQQGQRYQYTDPSGVQRTAIQRLPYTQQEIDLFRQKDTRQLPGGATATINRDYTQGRFNPNFIDQRFRDIVAQNPGGTYLQ